MTQLRYHQYDVTIVLSQYVDNGRPAIQLLAADTAHNEVQDIMPGDPIAVASVNLPDVSCPKDHTFIKDWAENEGILEWLVQNKLVETTGFSAQTGFVLADLVEITDHCRKIAGRL